MSREIAKDLADKLVEIRKDNLKWYDTKTKLHERNPDGYTKPKQAVVGGVVRSYKFSYEEGKEIAQGSMKIMFSTDASCECDVTVVILNDSEAHAGVTGERIVHNTRKLSDFNESIIEAYFSAYCDDISKWIVVYEKFDSYFHDESQNAIPRICEEADRSSLTDFWRENLRSLVRVLAASSKKNVMHGGLSSASSYAISAGTIKLINVARREK
jgi:hypothetical protein